MKRLNQREIEVAHVAADLLMKGTPETRIAEYCILKKMNAIQAGEFLKKLDTIPENIRMTIHNHVRDLLTGYNFDYSKSEGKVLKEWLKQNKYGQK